MSQVNCTSLMEFYELIERPLFVAFFTNPTCGVCTAAEPRFHEVMEKFPAVEWMESVPADQPDVAAQSLIFQVPAVLAFEGGKENLRLVREIDFGRLEEFLRSRTA